MSTEIEKYFSQKITGKYQSAVASATAGAMMTFCIQEPEFEQAILQSGKTFQECLNEITNGIGDSISDMEIYSRAVKFYFSTATVNFRMTIDLSGNNGAQKPDIKIKENENKTLSLSLDALLDF